jgi:hypothetical protein
VTTKEHFERLKRTVECLHRCVAVRVASKRVKEILPGGAAWEGEVEIFDLWGHPQSKRCYGWCYGEPEQCVTILESPEVDSVESAVKAGIAGQMNARQGLARTANLIHSLKANSPWMLVIPPCLVDFGLDLVPILSIA